MCLLISREIIQCVFTLFVPQLFIAPLSLARPLLDDGNPNTKSQPLIANNSECSGRTIPRQTETVHCVFAFPCGAGTEGYQPWLFLIDVSLSLPPPLFLSPPLSP